MIRFVKLLTGEDLVADITVTDDKYELKHPMRYIPTREGIAMGPLVPFMKSEKVEVLASHVVFTAVPDDDVVNAYNEKFGTGIVLPPSGLVT